MAKIRRQINGRGPQTKMPSELMTAQRSRLHFDGTVAQLFVRDRSSDAKSTIFGMHAEELRNSKRLGAIPNDHPKSLYHELRASRQQISRHHDSTVRWGLRNGQAIREQLRRYWEIVARGHRGTSAIDVHQFIHIHRLISRALLGKQGSWASGSIIFAEREWYLIMGQNKHIMRSFEFFDWLFKVVDAWTLSIFLGEYVTFLKSLLERIVDSDRSYSSSAMQIQMRLKASVDSVLSKYDEIGHPSSGSEFAFITEDESITLARIGSMITAKPQLRPIYDDEGSLSEDVVCSAQLPGETKVMSSHIESARGNNSHEQLTKVDTKSLASRLDEYTVELDRNRTYVSIDETGKTAVQPHELLQDNPVDFLSPSVNNDSAAKALDSATAASSAVNIRIDHDMGAYQVPTQTLRVDKDSAMSVHRTPGHGNALKRIMSWFKQSRSFKFFVNSVRRNRRASIDGVDADQANGKTAMNERRQSLHNRRGSTIPPHGTPTLPPRVSVPRNHNYQGKVMNRGYISTNPSEASHKPLEKTATMMHISHSAPNAESHDMHNVDIWDEFKRQRRVRRLSVPINHLDLSSSSDSGDAATKGEVFQNRLNCDGSSRSNLMKRMSRRKYNRSTQFFQNTD